MPALIGTLVCSLLALIRRGLLRSLLPARQRCAWIGELTGLGGIREARIAPIVRRRRRGISLRLSLLNRILRRIRGGSPGVRSLILWRRNGLLVLRHGASDSQQGYRAETQGAFDKRSM